jgi:hypothetical protein
MIEMDHSTPLLDQTTCDKVRKETAAYLQSRLAAKEFVGDLE